MERVADEVFFCAAKPDALEMLQTGANGLSQTRRLNRVGNRLVKEFECWDEHRGYTATDIGSGRCKEKWCASGSTKINLDTHRIKG
jgi:hypothetical protein